MYGGKLGTESYIQCKTFSISEEKKSELLKSTLRWLPYFGEEKNDITLEMYFKRAQNTDRYEFYTIFPSNLNFFHLREVNDSNVTIYETILTYKKSFPQSLTVIWLDENTWFLDDVYYSLEINFDLFAEEPSEVKMILGNLQEFMRISPIFQYKLNEGFPSLSTANYADHEVPLNEVVFSISLSPGLPNTTSYNIEIAGDGSIMSGISKSSKKVDLFQLTALLIEAKTIDWKYYFLNQKMEPFDHDGQSFSISVWHNGISYRITEPDLSDEHSALSKFVEKLRILCFQ